MKAVTTNLEAWAGAAAEAAAGDKAGVPAKGEVGSFNKSIQKPFYELAISKGGEQICRRETEQAPRARVRRRDEARENAALKTELPNHRDKVVWEPAVDQAEVPAGVKAREQVGEPDRVRAKAEERDRALEGSLNKSTNGFIPLNFLKKTSKANLTGTIQLISHN